MSGSLKKLWALIPALAVAPASHGIDRIVFRADEVEASGSTATDMQATLDLTGADPKLELTSSGLRAAESSRTLAAVVVHCERLVVRQPHVACERGSLRAGTSPIGALAMDAHLEYNTDTHALSGSATGLAIAGGVLAFNAASDAGGWKATAHAEGISLTRLRQLAAPWLTLPAQYSVDGVLAGDFSASRVGPAQAATIAGRVDNLNLTNVDGTIVAQAVAAKVAASAASRSGRTLFDVKVSSDSGQALAGPMLLDFRANPLELASSGAFSNRTLTVEQLQLHQQDLIDADATSVVTFGRKPAVSRAHLVIHSLQFPAAYASFMQISLASTDFASLQIRGTATGSFDMQDDLVTSANLSTDKLDVTDDKAKFGFNSLRAALHWSPQSDVAVEPSSVAWTSGSAYGIAGGAADIRFRMQGRDGRLLEPARIPVFDGAVVVIGFSISRPGAADMDVAFDAQVEPISMSKLSQAFGWPELSGELSGRIPGLTYHNHELSLAGNLEASVFDGTIIGRNLRLQDPLGPWPRLFADVTARNLNLDRVTHTFPIGSITGRVDADMQGLELFNWSPVAFDAKVYTTPADRSPHRISQRAVTSISSLGGGGGGVAAALQSGFLKFFDTFHYSRLGLSCQLRNDVCLMSGLEPTKTGYYIVKGGGLPRIDIIGNAGRVDWSTLLAQIESGMHSQNIIVR